MITGLYSAASGMIAQTEHQDVLAHNLANVGVAGFRKQRMVFRSFPDILLQQLQPSPPAGAEEGRQFLLASRVGTGAGINWAYVDFSNAQARHTGRTADVALLGDGFFVVQTPDGPRYTRNGSFYVDPADGLLKTVEGSHPVEDERGGPLALLDEDFMVGRAGEIFRDGVRVGTLAVVDFANRDLLAPEGASLFRFDGQDLEAQLLAPANLSVQQGSLESGNVDALLESVYLLDSFRNYEANQRVIAALDRTLDRAINDVGTL